MKSTTLIEQVYKYCNLHPNAKTKSTVEYFVASNHPERTIKHYIWQSGRTMSQSLVSPDQAENQKLRLLGTSRITTN